MPMYFLAQANPTLYHLLNNALLGAQTQITASVQSCQAAKEHIAQGKNPYHDWATLSVGEQWQQHLSLTGVGMEDINDAKAEIDQHAGHSGIPWVSGQAAGKNQPPIRVIADTVQAGYNVLLNRPLTSHEAAPAASALAIIFPTPQAASRWVTDAVGEQVVDLATQGSAAGRGLLALTQDCTRNSQDCVTLLEAKLQALIQGALPLSKQQLLAVSAEDLVLSPQLIEALRALDSRSQGLVTHKLAENVALQRVMHKAAIAQDLLQAGRQVPVIAANKPAQQQIELAVTQLEQQRQSLVFTAQLRRQLMSETLVQLLHYAREQYTQSSARGPTTPRPDFLQHEALPGDTP